MFSRRDLLFHSILDILPQIVLLPFSKSVISSVLSPSSALQNFLLFSPFGEYLKGAHHTDFSFRQCYNMKGPAEHFIHQKQRGNPSRIQLCNCQSHAKISSIVMQDLSIHAWPLMFSSNHIRWWETHPACEMQVALNDTAFSVSEISVFDKYHKTCLACAHVYVGCDTVPMNIPQKVIVVESRKCDTAPKYPVYVLKSPWKG